MARGDGQNMAPLTVRKLTVPARMARRIDEIEVSLQVGLAIEGGVERSLEKLTHDEERVLRMRFGIGERIHNLAEIGARCGLSRGWVREIETRALRQLRSDALGDFGDLQ